MRDKELYEAILGVQRPWRVIGVELDTGGREVRVEIENEERSQDFLIHSSAGAGTSRTGSGAGSME